MKTLKDILEVYKPKSADEKKFVDKHIVVKHKDRNGNGDDVFQATNIKTVGRKDERHGYDPNEDEKVYEEYEELDETSHQKMIKAYAKAKSFAHGGPAFYGDETEKSPEDFEKQAARIKSKIPTHMHKDAENAARIEIRGLRPGHVGGYDRLALRKPAEAKPTKSQTRLRKDIIAAGVEKQKRTKKANLPEETEHLEEKLKVSDGIGAWISDFIHSKNPKFAGKSKKERTQMALGAFYSAKRGE